MKKTTLAVIFLSTALTLTACPPQAQAWDRWSKLGRGFANLLMGSGELITQVGAMSKTERWPVAAAGGLMKGAFYTILRTAAGAFEIITFAVPIPAGYAPIMEPEFVYGTSPDYHEDDPVWGDDEIERIY